MGNKVNAAIIVIYADKLISEYYVMATARHDGQSASDDRLIIRITLYLNYKLKYIEII